MNKVILMGRLTREPDIRYSQGENAMAIARYTLAVDRRMKKTENSSEQTADFISCVAFAKHAEFAERYLHQGIKIVIEGRIQTGSYTNKDGQKVYTTEVVVENCEFAESKGSAGSGSRPSPEDAENESIYGENASGAGDGFMNIPDGVEDEGLPFN